MGPRVRWSSVCLAALVGLAPPPLSARKKSSKAVHAHKAPAPAPVPAPSPLGPATAPVLPAERPAMRLSADELLARYAQTIGGPAFRALKDRLATGTVEFVPSDGGAPHQGKLELAWRAEGRAREIWTLPEGRLRRVYDGANSSVVGPGIKRRLLRAAERAELSRTVTLFSPALVLGLEGATLERTEQLDGRSSAVVKTRSGDFVWFDAQTALPLRMDILEERPEPGRAGEFQPTQVFFDDWRPLGAVQLPHLIRRVRPEGETTYRLLEVRQDLELPDGLFKKPTWWRR